MPQIIPIRDLRDTTKVSELCNASNEPIYVTKNGYGDMVIMSMAAYEKQLAQIEIYNRVMESRTQIANGEGIDGPTAMARLRKKYAE